MRLFAARQAMSVIHLWDAPDIVKIYLKSVICGREKKSIRGAAQAAALDAAQAAALDATGAAAWVVAGLLSGMLQGSNSTRLASPNSIGGLNHDKQSSRAGGERNEAALGAAGRRGRGAGRGVDVFSTDGCATKGGVMAITIDELIEELQRARERIGSGLAGVYLGKGDETKQGRPIVCVTVRTSASPRRVDLT